jgi:CBS domain-containing protein
MLARDIMTHKVIGISPDATVLDAANLLLDYRISGVPVLDTSHHIIGIVTQADIISKDGQTVASIMTPRVVSVHLETPVDEIAQILASNGYKRVPVITGREVVGIVSRADIVRMVASRWICPTCGAIQQGRIPDRCYTCGADGNHFEHELDPRLEITTRQ